MISLIWNIKQKITKELTKQRKPDSQVQTGMVFPAGKGGEGGVGQRVECRAMEGNWTSGGERTAKNGTISLTNATPTGSIKNEGFIGSGIKRPGF